MIAHQRWVFRRLGLWETFAVGFAILLPILSAFVFPDFLPDDFDVFWKAANGTSLEGFYYPHWALFILKPFTLFRSGLFAYFAWNIMNVLGMFYAVRVFGGKAAVLLLCNPMIFNIYFGGAVGVVAAGIAFYAYYLERRPILAGWGAAVAFIKPQLGLPLILVLALTADTSWKNRFLSTIPSFIALGLSLLAYGEWITGLLDRLQNAPPNAVASITLWQYFGPIVAVLWLGLFIPKLTRNQRLLMVTAVSALALPYYQHTGLLTMFMFPVGYLSLLSNIAYAQIFMDWAGVRISVIIPVLVYGWLLWKAYSQWQTERNIRDIE